MSRCPFLMVLVSVLLTNGKLVVGQEDDQMIDEVMKDKKMSDMVKKMAMSSMDMVKDQDMMFLKAGVDTTDSTSTTAMKAMFTNTEDKAREMADVKRSQNLLVDELSHMLHVPKRRMADSMRKLLFELGVEIQGLGTNDNNCDEADKFKCDPRARFRSLDGTCNNLRKPIWGASFIPLRRFLQPEYGDDVSSPRTLARSGQELPSARVVSLGVHEDNSRGPAGARSSHMLMQWGQFLDHDITSTPIFSGASGSHAGCCTRAGVITPGIPPEERDICFPIKLPENDPQFTTKTCLNFVRSIQVDNTECGQAPVEQMNQITAFVDGSMVYGSSRNNAESLRAQTGGLLKTSPNDLLPENERRTCLKTKKTDFCFKAGDARVNEQMALATLHTVWMREHNRMARELSRVNPAWDDEKLYQETRRIVGAKLQHITYNEFLPAVLGEEHMQHFRLSPSLRGFDDMYDDQVDPSIRNSFAAAAYRFGHSMVRTMFSQLDRNFRRMDSLRLKSSFGNTSHLIRDDGDGVNRYIRGLLDDRANKIDRFMSSQVTQHLFEDSSGNSLDLAAINIQRGRDHGLPPYNAWRQWCNLPVAQRFRRGEGGLVDHPNHAIRKLANVYSDPDDIDLFAGGISERPVRGGLVGPTFACILSHQFKALKVGDRFWYERPTPDIGFTQNQLDAIRQTTLAKVLCDNTDILRMQPNAFQIQWRQNRRQSCQDLTQVSLEAWSDDPDVRDNAIIHFDDVTEDNSINSINNEFDNDGDDTEVINDNDNNGFSDNVDTGFIDDGFNNDNDDTVFNNDNGFNDNGENDFNNNDNGDDFNNNDNEFTNNGGDNSFNNDDGDSGFNNEENGFNNNDNNDQNDNDFDNDDNDFNSDNDNGSNDFNDEDISNNGNGFDDNGNDGFNDNGFNDGNNGFGNNNQDNGVSNGDNFDDGNSDNNFGNDDNQEDNFGNGNGGNDNFDDEFNEENNNFNENDDGSETQVTGDEFDDTGNDNNDFDNNFNNDENFRNSDTKIDSDFRNTDNFNANGNFDNSDADNNNDNRNNNNRNNNNRNNNNRNNRNNRNNNRNNRNNRNNNKAFPQRNDNRQPNGNLGPWGQWSICLRGKNTRVRTCFQGKPCRGRSIQTKRCGRNTWTAWSEWSTCARGQERRERTCTGRIRSCDGSAREFRPCANSNGAEVTWGPWGNWGSCRNGKRFRRRRCQMPSGGQQRCIGPSSDSEMCGNRSVDCSQGLFRLLNPDLCS